MANHSPRTLETLGLVPLERACQLSPKTIEVPTHVNLQSITEIDVVNQSFCAKLDIHMRLPRHLHQRLEMSRELALGRLYAFKNALEVLEGPDARTEDVVDESGQVAEKWITVVLKARFENRFDVRNFPVDAHQLHLQLTSNVPAVLGNLDHKTLPTLVLQKDDRRPSVTQAHKLFLGRDVWGLEPGITEMNALSTPGSSGCGRQYSHYWLSVNIVRRPMYTLSTVALPTFLYTSLCFLAPLISQQRDRLDMVLALILVNVAHRMIVAPALPNVGYCTFIDKYILFASLIPCLFLVQIVLCQGIKLPAFAEPVCLSKDSAYPQAAAGGLAATWTCSNALFGTVLLWKRTRR